MVRTLTSTHKKLSDQQVLDLVLAGRWIVDTEQGIVLSNGVEVTRQEDYDGNVFVQLYAGGCRRTIALGLLVWMARTETTLPNEWEVHHIDKCKSNCMWDNLLAAHHLDHDKLHRAVNFADKEDVPF